MTITDNGQLIQLHPVIAAMIELLTEKQDGVWKRQLGRVELHFSPTEVSMKVFDGPVFTGFRKTKDKPRPEPVTAPGCQRK